MTTENQSPSTGIKGLTIKLHVDTTKPDTDKTVSKFKSKFIQKSFLNERITERTHMEEEKENLRAEAVTVIELTDKEKKHNVVFMKNGIEIGYGISGSPMPEGIVPIYLPVEAALELVQNITEEKAKRMSDFNSSQEAVLWVLGEIEMWWHKKSNTSDSE